MQKKKKTIIYLISGLLVIAVIGAITYFAWPKKETNKPTQNNQSTNWEEQVSQLKTQLNSVKN